MANIATVSVAAFVKRDVPRGRVTAHGLLRAMTRYFGRTYCVPTWGYDDYPHGCVFVQHGEKWSPTGVVHAWERFGALLDALWVRWYDDGGDHDALFRFDGEYGESVRCHYGFDSVRLHVAEGFDPLASGAGWRVAHPGVWEADIGGTYLAGNDRCGLLADKCPSLPSLTTPVRGRLLGRDSFRWADDEFPAELRALEPVVRAGATGVDFRWHGRPTRVYRLRGERWWAWNLDDWDNCRAPAWLSFCATRGGAGCGKCSGRSSDVGEQDLPVGTPRAALFPRFP
jgi:hypothetical protein